MGKGKESVLPGFKGERGKERLSVKTRCTQSNVANMCRSPDRFTYLNFCLFCPYYCICHCTILWHQMKKEKSPCLFALPQPLLQSLSLQPRVFKLAGTIEQTGGYNYSIKGKNKNKIQGCQTRCATLHIKL